MSEQIQMASTIINQIIELRGFKETRKWYSQTDWVREFENPFESEELIAEGAGI